MIDCNERKTRVAQKIKAVMLGHAVGDAVGVPVEFVSREELRADPVVDMTGFGTHSVPAGSWSDDTSMAICALDSLVKKGKFDADDILRNFGKWYYEGNFTPTGEMFDVGNVCYTAIQRYFAEHIPADQCGSSDEYSNGNGSLMRIHPFVLYAYAKDLSNADRSALIESGSALTHAHERSKIGCLIYSFVLEKLLNDPTKDAITRGLEEAKQSLGTRAEISHYARLFDSEFASLSEEEIRSSGYIVDTLEAALWCALNTDSYRACILKAVNLGSDTDTVAAVAGGIAGALYGYDAIPRLWRDLLLKREQIEGLCEKAGMTWVE